MGNWRLVFQNSETQIQESQLDCFQVQDNPKNEITVKRLQWLTGLLLVIISTSCVSVPVNHYQDGKSLRKGEFDAGVGLALGRTIAFGISRIDSSGYVLDESSEGPPLPILNISGRYGLTPKFDLGGNLFTSISSNGFKIYGKYTFLDSLSKWGVSIMPVIGYASGKVTGSGSSTFEGTTTSSWENEISHGAFIAELPLLMSYHINHQFAFTFGPRIYYYKLNSKDETKWILLNETETNKVNRSFFSSAFSFGFQYRGIRPELTLVGVENITTEKTDWIPYLGVGFYGIKGFWALVDQIF